MSRLQAPGRRRLRPLKLLKRERPQLATCVFEFPHPCSPTSSTATCTRSACRWVLSSVPLHCRVPEAEPATPAARDRQFREGAETRPFQVGRLPLLHIGSNGAPSPPPAWNVLSCSPLCRPLSGGLGPPLAGGPPPPPPHTHTHTHTHTHKKLGPSLFASILPPI
jgi:hypothetical protein